MPVTHPKVAVLLAAYNGMEWIEEQLASILAQIDVDLTVYISVDLSTDGTEAWCRDFSGKQDAVVALPPAGRFGGASRNFFRLIRDVDLSDYDFVAFADQDDVWDLDKLSRATQAILSRDIDAYSSNVTAFWPDGRTKLVNKAQQQVAWDYLFEAAGPGCTYVMSRKLVASLKVSILANWEKLQEVSLHDWYCYAFARSHNFKWFIDPQPSMRYRQHDSNQFGANTSIRSFVARHRMIRSGWWFSQVQAIVELSGNEAQLPVQFQKKMNTRDLILLALQASRCRRRGRDKIAFFFICLLGTGVKG
ncbi:glycosyltransferase [Pseudomonas syringae group sp. J309-1]|uniref:glycosyltransferase n=1 Tax=Pseudomonas syringae group sp. J309-1 TaxID=3079588 RepID=UPI0029123F8F|nr:glycosyltransferase [Pseudomonas syringae group sp. J309-1]MDU8362136.1 glycosyltransferase [Pseudomonas syringae group sp. J309-1]